jgi:single-strand DNA-binding protein
LLKGRAISLAVPGVDSGGHGRRSRERPPLAVVRSKQERAMSSDCFTVQVGNLTDEPELRFPQNGTLVTNFRLAVNQRVMELDGTWRDGEALLLPRQRLARPGLKRRRIPVQGNRAVVLGRLRSRSWETPEGEKRTVTEIDADEVAPSLKWAIARPERATRTTERGSEPCAERDAFNDPPPSQPFTRYKPCGCARASSSTVTLARRSP